MKFNKRRWKHHTVGKRQVLYYPDFKSEPAMSFKSLPTYQTGCVYCGAHRRYLVEHEGNSTCMECACVQPASNVLQIHSYGGNYSRIKRHLYNKRVYFVDIIRGIRGERRSTISDTDYSNLKTVCKGISVNEWKTKRLQPLMGPMKSLKLNKYKHAKGWLAFRLSRGAYRPVRISKQDLDRLVILFNQVRLVYEEIRKWVCPNRKIFISYSYLFLCLVNLINKPEYGLDVTAPVNKKSRSIQDRLWRAICCKLGWKWIPLPL